MARSNKAPAFGRDAGTKLTVMRRMGQGNPELVTAARTRSFASPSAASGNPTIVNAGIADAKWASTSMQAPFTPSIVTQRVVPRLIRSPLGGVRPGGALRGAQNGNHVEAHIGVKLLLIEIGRASCRERVEVGAGRG